MKRQLELELQESKAGQMRAKELLLKHGLSTDKDFFELSSSEVDKVLAAAKEYKYKKSRNAPGSLGRMFYYHAQNAK